MKLYTAYLTFRIGNNKHGNEFSEWIVKMSIKIFYMIVFIGDNFRVFTGENISEKYFFYLISFRKKSFKKINMFGNMNIE